jgi:hypothetical protein
MIFESAVSAVVEMVVRGGATVASVSPRCEGSTAGAASGAGSGALGDDSFTSGIAAHGFTVNQSPIVFVGGGNEYTKRRRIYIWLGKVLRMDRSIF